MYVIILKKTPLVKFIRNHIWDSTGVFSISSLVKISVISLISSLSLKLYLNLLVYDGKIFGSSLKVFGNLRKFSEMFGNVCVTFGQVLKNLRKSSENGQKRRHQHVCIIKRTLHVSSKIWVLCSLGKNTGHSNIKFISSRHHVISSIYVPADYVLFYL